MSTKPVTRSRNPIGANMRTTRSGQMHRRWAAHKVAQQRPALPLRIRLAESPKKRGRPKGSKSTPERIRLEQMCSRDQCDRMAERFGDFVTERLCETHFAEEEVRNKRSVTEERTTSSEETVSTERTVTAEEGSVCAPSDDKSLPEVSLTINDVFQELSHENQRLFKELLFANKYIEILTKFKLLFDTYSAAFQNILNANQWQEFENIDKEFDDFTKELKTHLIPEEGTQFTEEALIDPLVCGHCEQQCLSRETLNTHLKSHQNSGNIEDLNEDLNNKETDKGSEQMEAEDNNSDNPVNKEDVNSSPKKLTEMVDMAKGTEDMRQVETATKPFSGQHICSDCGQIFPTKYFMTIHKRMHQKKSEDPTGDGHGLREKKWFVCSYPDCQFKSTISSALELHNNMKHKKELFVCDKCGQGFRSELLHNYHKLSHRQPVANGFVCQWPDCDYRANSKSRLREHKRIHTNRPPFVCDYCDKSVRSRAALCNHMKIHSKTYQALNKSRTSPKTIKLNTKPNTITKRLIIVRSSSGTTVSTPSPVTAIVAKPTTTCTPFLAEDESDGQRSNRPILRPIVSSTPTQTLRVFTQQNTETQDLSSEKTRTDTNSSERPAPQNVVKPFIHSPPQNRSPSTQTPKTSESSTHSVRLIRINNNTDQELESSTDQSSTVAEKIADTFGCIYSGCGFVAKAQVLFEHYVTVHGNEETHRSGHESNQSTTNVNYSNLVQHLNESSDALLIPVNPLTAQLPSSSVRPNSGIKVIRRQITGGRLSSDPSTVSLANVRSIRPIISHPITFVTQQSLSAVRMARSDEQHN